MGQIEGLMGVGILDPGTLSLKLSEECVVKTYKVIPPQEYPLNRQSGLRVVIQLQRGVIGGHKAIIMRPDYHETHPGWGHGTEYLELMGAVRFREVLGLDDGSTVEVEFDGHYAWWASATWVNVHCPRMCNTHFSQCFALF